METNKRKHFVPWRSSQTSHLWHFPCRSCGTELVATLNNFHSDGGPLCSACRYVPGVKRWSGWEAMAKAEQSGDLTAGI